VTAGLKILEFFLTYLQNGLTLWKNYDANLNNLKYKNIQTAF